MIENIVMQVALKEGQKAGAKVASKIATSVASALIANKVVREVRKNDKPLILISDPEGREKEIRNRIIRDSIFGASISIIGVGLNMMIGNKIEASDYSSDYFI